MAHDIAIPESLETFYRATPYARAALLAAEPGPSGDVRLDGLAATVAEYLAKRYRLPVVPTWLCAPGRILQKPYFTTASADDGMHEYLAFASPAENRHRIISTEYLPLRRASSSR